MTALLVADYLGQPDLRAQLGSVGLAEQDVDDLRRLARAIIALVTQLGGDYLPDAKGIPGDLVQRGQLVRGTVAAALEKALPDDPEMRVWLEAVRLGVGVVDLVYDLRTLADLCAEHDTNAENAHSALSAADAVEFALRTDDTPESTRARNTIARLWTVFRRAYDRAAAAGRTLGPGRERHFPPLALLASHRRARRRPVSLVPTAAAVARRSGPPRGNTSRPPSMAGSPRSSVKIPSAPAVPDFAGVALIEGESLDAIKVLRSEPPPRPGAAAAAAAEPSKMPSTPPTAGERLSWSDTRKQNRQTVEIEVGIASQSNLYLGFTENLSDAGVFVATYVAKPIGAQVDVVLAFPNGDVLKIHGVVRWLRDPTPDGWPGMGVQFENLSPEDESKIRKFLALRDPLFYDD